MNKHTLRTVAILFLTGVATSVLVEFVLFHEHYSANLVLPIAQAAGFWAAFTLGWPLWFRQQPGNRLSLWPYLALVSALVVVTATVQIRFGLW